MALYFRILEMVIQYLIFEKQIFNIMLVSLIEFIMYVSVLIVSMLAFCKCGPPDVDLILYAVL